jgi:hypothetical protein
MVPPTHLIFAALVIAVACQSARAQDNVELLTLEIPKQGIAKALPSLWSHTSGLANPRL